MYRNGSVSLITSWSAVITSLCLLARPPVIAQESPLDYPQWRGPDRAGSAAAFVEPEVWPEQLTRNWTVEVGSGLATPIVIGARVYTFTRQETDEVLTAVDTATGRVVWSVRYAAPYQMKEGTFNHGPGPKSTPLFKDGKLYALGISGM